MRHRQLNVDPHKPLSMHAIVLGTGEEVIATLTDAANDLQLSASQFTAIGAFSRVVLGYFDLQLRDYRHIEIEEQVEVVSLLGDVTLRDGKSSLHAHVTVSKRDGTAWGGHLLEAHVRPTLEVLLTESPAALHRYHDPQTGLALLKDH